MIERNDLIVLGRKIGTFAGWDQGATLSFSFYNFEPIEGLAIAAGDLFINYDTGQVSSYQSEDKCITYDLLWHIKDLPQVKEMPND